MDDCKDVDYLILVDNNTDKMEVELRKNFADTEIIAIDDSYRLLIDGIMCNLAFFEKKVLHIK